MYVHIHGTYIRHLVQFVFHHLYIFHIIGYLLLPICDMNQIKIKRRNPHSTQTEQEIFA